MRTALHGFFNGDTATFDANDEIHVPPLAQTAPVIGYCDVAGGFVGLGGLAAVGILRAIWPTTPDGMYAVAMGT